MTTAMLIKYIGMTRMLVYKTLGERTIGDGNWATGTAESLS